MARPGPRTINRYSNEFKAAAVRLSQLPGTSARANTPSWLLLSGSLRWCRQLR